MVPGAASTGLVAPIRVLTTLKVPSGPSTTMTTAGDRVMKATRSVVERLTAVLGVVGLRPPRW